jgi:Tfp pilus assembly protein PilZ
LINDSSISEKLDHRRRETMERHKRTRKRAIFGRIRGKKRRKIKRVTLRNTIHFGPHRPFEHTSYITDLSDKGVGLKTNRVFMPGTKLYMSIETAYGGYEAEGIVVWAKKITPKMVQLVKTGMGVRFTHVNNGLVNLYEEKIKEELVEHGRLEIH